MNLQNQLVYGSDEVPPAQIELVAGPISASLDPVTGLLSFISYEGSELVRGIYATVRDTGWGALFAQLSDIEIERTLDACTIKFNASHKREDIEFFWKGKITASPAGLDYELVGTANRDFKTQRTGLFVLHPRHTQFHQIEHNDGSVTEGLRLKNSVSPSEPFTDFNALEVEHEGRRCRIEFEGDEFGIEDQRNWGDPSFKSYCALHKLKPYTLRQGEQVVQAIRIKVLGLGEYDFDINARPAHFQQPYKPAYVRLDHPADQSEVALLGMLGGRVQGSASSLSSYVMARGKALELDADDFQYEDLEGIDLVFVEPFEKTGEVFAAVDRPEIPWMGLSRDRLADVNRNRTGVQGRGVAFGFNPQVHTFDSLSILEAPTSIPSMALTAKLIGGNSHIGPVSFSGEHEDVRANGLIGAAFYLRVLERYIQSRASGLTIAQIGGPNSLIQGDHVAAGFHVIADYAEQDWEKAGSLAPLRRASYTGLALFDGERIRVLIGNLRPERTVVKLGKRIQSAHTVLLRILDEDSVVAATQTPLTWRKGAIQRVTGPLSEVVLKPYGYVCLETELG